MFQVRILVGPPTFARLRCRWTRATVGRPNSARLRCRQTRGVRRDRESTLEAEDSEAMPARGGGAPREVRKAESLRSRPKDSEAVPTRDSLEPLRSANALSN